MSYTVVTIGAATQDVFLISKNFRPVRIREQLYNVLEYGSKVEVEDVFYDTGGGATNSAVTFARQGIKAAAMVKLGVDSAGREIIHALRKESVSTDLIIKSTKAHTGFSTLIKPYNGDRTVLVHRGSSAEYHKKDFAFSDIKTDWIYISSLAGNLDLLRTIIDWANRHEVYVAINPGSREITKSGRLLRLLARTQIVLLNLDEASDLTKARNTQAVIRALYNKGIHTALITDGPRGSYCLHDGVVYRSGLYRKVRVVDRTGAGDAYGSGFVAAIIRGKSIEQAMSFAAANSTSVISYVGAKTGILRTHDVANIKIKKVSL